jgi:molybdopterin-guanine dinucleotide biosynthesis protein A|tara:strand:+ start:724 stop:1335 length:612 start_codon:yes stop_codon:yes gene_type:complete
MNENNFLGTILAGGKSSRFGEDKSTTKLGDKTLLDHTVGKIKNEFTEILVISNNKELNFKNNKIHVVEDCIEGQLGPLVGILTAMKWVLKNKKKYKWIASFPCDTPFFDTKIINELKIKVKETSKKLIFLNSNKKRHNIFGLWSLDLIEILEKDIKNNFRKVELWADKVGYENININSEKFDRFLNINTKNDLEEAKENLDKI